MDFSHADLSFLCNLNPEDLRRLLRRANLISGERYTLAEAQEISALVNANRDRMERQKDYYKGERWARVRAAVLERDESTCRYCGSKERPEVHHLTYRWKDEPGEEEPEIRSCLVVCYSCHKKIHRRYST